MSKPLSPLEIQTLVRIAEAEDVFYKYPSKRHDHSHRIVVCAGVTVEHLNVSVVDVLRFEGYVEVLDKNHSGTSYIAPTQLGLSTIKETGEQLLRFNRI